MRRRTVAKRDALHQVQPAEPTGYSHQDDDRRGARGNGAYRSIRFRGNGVDDVLRHDAQVERDRDHIGDRDDAVAQALESLAEAVEFVFPVKRLDHPDVVADRRADQPGQSGDRDRSDHREPAKRALQHRHDDQESAAEDRGEGSDRGASDRPEAGAGHSAGTHQWCRRAGYFGESRLYVMR